MTWVDVDSIKTRAHGQWSGILRTLGVPEKILEHRPMPCPMCAGTDRFQYTDRFGEGNYICRKCGAGGGIKLLQGVMGWSFARTVQEIERCLGLPLPTVPVKSQANTPALMARIWSSAQALQVGDEVVQYLRSRDLGRSCWPEVLRCHPHLGYFEKDAQNKSHLVARYPAMLARVQAMDGSLVALHRTYLHGGAQIDGQAKKLLARGVAGAAVRLFEATDELAITEGIETALAVHLATGRPVWSALNAGNLAQLWLPASVKRIWIYADNDAHFIGQASAFALAHRLKREDGQSGVQRDVHVEIPRRAGSDWADVWREMVARRKTLPRP